ncbi:hypothetical protein MMC22_003940 [Lobaria immixta]|nr:hypothetical protein [Lobaria immixta]
MLLPRLVTARPLHHLPRTPLRASHLPRTSRPVSRCTQRRCLSQAAIDDPTKDVEELTGDPEIDDPNMNGGYIDPPRQPRQLRDPYGDWWDKQERRNFGEPVHEDNDILGMFSLEEYRHFTPAKGFFLLGCAIATVGGLCGIVSLYYPDKPSVPRTFPGGLDRELGGAGAVPAPSDEEA